MRNDVTTELSGKIILGKGTDKIMPDLANMLFVAIDVPLENIFHVIRPIKRNSG